MKFRLEREWIDGTFQVQLYYESSPYYGPIRFVNYSEAVFTPSRLHVPFQYIVFDNSYCIIHIPSLHKTFKGKGAGITEPYDIDPHCKAMNFIEDSMRGTRYAGNKLHVTAGRYDGKFMEAYIQRKNNIKEIVAF